MRDTDFNEIVINLEKIHEFGVSQLADYKKNNPGTPRTEGSHIQISGVWLPRNTGVAKLMSDPETFIFQNIESYWTLYGSALEIFESPSVQFLMRPMMELAYSRILLYTQKPKSKQRDLAVMFWLCIDGILENKDILKTYNAFVQLLSSEEDKEYFRNLRSEGYPFAKLHKKLHGLFPSIMDPEMEKQLLKILVDLWGMESLKNYPIGKQFRQISMFVHANPVILRQLSLGRGNRDHILRCAKILEFTGITTLKLAEKEWGVLVKDSEDLKKIEAEFGEQLLKLWKSKENDQY